jgi:hypothetical protein
MLTCSEGTGLSGFLLSEGDWVADGINTWQVKEKGTGCSAKLSNPTQTQLSHVPKHSGVTKEGKVVFLGQDIHSIAPLFLAPLPPEKFIFYSTPLLAHLHVRTGEAWK